jgi:hypothetical protein
MAWGRVPSISSFPENTFVNSGLAASVSEVPINAAVSFRKCIN